MEGVKEYLLSKYFSSFGYIVAVLHLPALMIFVGLTGQQRTSERRSFRCPSSPDSRDDCLAQYDKQYNSPFPLYGFVLLCFCSILTVCIAYSWCFVKSRVDELEAALKPDPENPRRRPRVTTQGVFYSYFLHLLVRLCLGILFVLIQNFVFYPDDFPRNFSCVYPRMPNITFHCENLTGSYNSTVLNAISIVNSFFAFLVFGELCYLVRKAVQRKQFTFDSEFCQNHLNKKKGNQKEINVFTFRMKMRILEETEILDLAKEPKRPQSDSDVFVNLVVYPERAKHKFPELLDRHKIFDINLKSQHGAVAIKKLEELFLPNEDTQDPRKILVVGRPGIGKSTFCSELLRAWSKGDLLLGSNQSFELLFLFKFRWFNTGAAEKISLKKLLSYASPEGDLADEVFQYILDNPKKILLVFDGLDEFNHHESCLEVEQAQYRNSPTEKMPLSALYIKLVRGKQLCGATVLTTCRPDVVKSVAGIPFDRILEIVGFTPEKVQEYIRNFEHNAKTVNTIWSHLSSNSELLSLCYIPGSCFIVCSLLKELIELQDQGALPTTSTETHEEALRLFVFKRNPQFRGKLLRREFLIGDVDFSNSVEETLSKAGSLAKTGIEEGRLVFDSREVHGMKDCGLFNRIPVSHFFAPFTWKSHFCFIHLTFQEFLAAREIAKMKPSDLHDFIISNASDPKWHLVIQFVAGLLRGQENEAVNRFVSLLSDLLVEEPVSNEAKQKALLMLKCLQEYNNEATTKRVASELQRNSKFNGKINLSDFEVTSAYCPAIVYFMKYLKPTVLNLGVNSITEQGVSHLCDALKEVNCKLTKLNLEDNKITDEGVSHLSDALKHENCRVTNLNLRGNNITNQGVSYLCDALKNVNCKLTKLNLSLNNITDQGVSELCEALKNENCKLTELNLLFNRYIAEKSRKQLSEVLRKVVVNPF